MSEYPEVLMDLGEAVGLALERRGVASVVASEAAWEAMEEVRQRWGGTGPYIPKARYLERERRDLEIWEDYRAGLSYVEMARKHDLTEQRIRVIINVARAGRAQKVDAPRLLEETG
jgi:Mor family transcriptional regulator